MLFLAAAVALTAAAPASAGQILYADHDGLYAVNEDGSGKRELINADAFGADAVYEPWVQPNGSTVLFQGRDPAPGYGGLYCGFNCVTVWAWPAGTDNVLQLTGNPTGCGDPRDLCAGLNVDGRISSDNQTLYYTQIYAEPNSSGTFNSISTPYKAKVQDGGDPNAQELKGDCKTEENTPSPDDPAVIVFEDCNNNYYDDANTLPYKLLYIGSPGGSKVLIGGDDTDIAGVAWRPDGNALLTTEGGDNPGIWTIGLGGAEPTFRRIAAITWDSDHSQFSTQPTFVGNDKIAFGYGKDIYTLPASCTDCTIGQATKIVGPVESLSGVSWTSHAVPGPPAPKPTPTATPTSTPTSTPTAAPTPGGQLKVALSPKGLKDNVFARKGAPVAFTASAPGSLILQATVTAKQARQLGINRRATRPVVVAKGTTSLTKAGAGTLTLKPTRTAARRLRSLRRAITLSLIGEYSAGNEKRVVTGRLSVSAR